MTSFLLSAFTIAAFPYNALVVLEGAPGPEKTGWLADLVSWLAAQGRRPAVVYLGPELDLGDTGKDTWKFRQAGANPVALAAPGFYQVTSTAEAEPDTMLTQMVPALAPYADLILVDFWSPASTAAFRAFTESGENPRAVALIASEPVTASIPVFAPHQVPEVGRYLLDQLPCREQ